MFSYMYIEDLGKRLIFLPVQKHVALLLHELLFKADEKLYLFTLDDKLGNLLVKTSLLFLVSCFFIVKIFCSRRRNVRQQPVSKDVSFFSMRTILFV